MLAAELGVSSLPSVVLFDDGVPEVFSGDVLDPLQIKEWVVNEIRSDDVEVVDAAVLANIVRRTQSLLAVFVSELKHLEEEVAAMDELRTLCDSLDVSMALIPGRQDARKFGIVQLPSVAYFENGVPSVYDGSIDDAPLLVEWVEDQRTADTIEKVTEEILAYLAETKEYLAVFFTGPCDERAKTDQECKRVLTELEKIDDELDEYGITLVTTEDIKYAGVKLKLRRFPSLGIFRNGHFLSYNGSLLDERDVLTWLVDKDTLDLKGQVEKVGTTMLDKLAKDEEQVVALIYRDGNDKRTQEVLDRLDMVVHKVEQMGVAMVKSADAGFVAAEFGLSTDELPLLVLFERGVPIVFPKDADILDVQEVFSWISEMVERQEMPTVDVAVLKRCIERIDDLVVVFYDAEKRKHQEFITVLEFIDDDAERLDVNMAKVNN